MFDIINMKHDDTICFVCKPTQIIYSSAGLSGKMCSISNNGVNVSKVIIALNVGCDVNGTYYVSDGKQQGVHWALLAIDLKNQRTYYGDSLGWPLPSNLAKTVGSNLKRLEGDLGINITTSLENIIVINKLSKCTNDASTNSSASCKWFYPLQSCPNVCGVIVVCMGALLCDHWNSWLTWGNEIIEVPLLSNPSMNSRQLRLIVISWIVNKSVNTGVFIPEKTPKHMCTNNSLIMDTSNASKKRESENVFEEYQVSHTCITTKVITECAKVDTEPTIDSDDDFMPGNNTKEQSKMKSNETDSEDELIKSEVRKPLILGMLPDGYTYKMLTVTHFKDVESFNCNFKIKLETEESARKWIAKYNEKTKEMMVYECCKNLGGMRVIKKLYLRCQHKQRQSGKHAKSSKALKTTHKQHNDKNTDCPAQIVITIHPPKKHGLFCVDVTLKHTHNHRLDVADALRFRPVSENTKEKYYDLFKQGHSPSSAHLEYETHLAYLDDSKLLADRNVNPKMSDVYNLFNKWRKSNLGVRTGKGLFTELEKRINVYNDTYNNVGGKAIIQKFYKGSKVKGHSDIEEVEQPLILAICTPLMSRVHQHIYQSKELVFVDASSSFEDFNNPLFVISTSSAAGGLPLGIVVTSAESSDVIHRGMTTLKELFPKSAFYGNGYPTNIIIDDSSAEREGLHQTWPSSSIFMCTFHFLQSMWRWLLCSKNNNYI